jgi:tRNA threonylcarbamoyladenosine biosynthesis protein TsaB
MNILALDSTAVSASAAVARDTHTLAEFSADNGLTHSELLLPMAEATMQACSLEVADIDLFACTVGPGSFTGVRIGVATVKGLAFGTGKRCAAVSTLEALAENLVPLTGIYCPVMDARRGQVYNALFEYRSGVLKRLCPDRAISLVSLGEELTEKYHGIPIWLAGDGYTIAREALDHTGIKIQTTPTALILQSAAAVARCAYRMAEAGITVSDTALVPTYLRLPQAERERLAKESAHAKS